MQQDVKAVYMGAAREVVTPNGMRVRLRSGETVRGEVAAWLLEKWPAQFRREAPGTPERATREVDPGTLTTKA